MRDTVRARRRRRRRRTTAVQSQVGRNIHKLRLLRGYTIEELAARAKKTDKHIGQIERGFVDVGINVLYSIARALSVTVGELFVGVRRREPKTTLYLLTDRHVALLNGALREIQRSRIPPKTAPRKA